MPKFYFTFGLTKNYPYYGGWSEIIAANKWTAYSVFTALHPTRKGCPIADCYIANCTGVYTEEEWQKTNAYETGKHRGYGCHERITVERTGKGDCRVKNPYDTENDNDDSEV